MKISQGLIPGIMTLIILSLSNSLMANEHSQMEITGRLNIVVGNGKPTNDIPGYGLVGHYKLSDGWYVGLTLDHSPAFDFERTSSIVGITQDPAVKDVDAVGTMTQFTAFFEKRYPNEAGNLQWFWNLGAGFASVDFDDVSGPVQGGGTFDITTSTDTEPLITASVGVQQRLNESWSARYSLDLEHHFANWQLTDRVSSNTGTIDDYSLYGIRLGINYAF